MPAIAGKDGGVKIGEAAVANLNNWKLDINCDMKDSTSFSSNGWKENIPTLKDWSGSVDGDWNVAYDTEGQKALQDALLGGTSAVMEFDVDATHHYSGTAFIKKISIGEKVDDKVTFSADIQGTGALTFA